MDAKDRERIKSNFTELVKVTEWNKEIEGFLEQKSELKKLLASVQSCATEEEKKQKFYQDIQRRGPKAFEYLIGCLLNSGNFGAADVLNKDVGHAVDVKVKLRSNSNKVFSNSIEKKEDKRGIPLGNVRVIEDRKPLVVKVKRATMFMNPENCYPMKSKPRGLVLIIDNEDFEDNSKKRVGSHVDSANLYSLFTQLGFTVEVKRNQKRKEMIDTIHEFSQRLDHGDMCVLAVLSHGYRGVILGTDSLPVPEDWIPKQFNNALSPHLQGKPKFFIFQACRGDESDYGVSAMKKRTSTDTSVSNEPKLVTWNDMLIANATVEDYKAHRDFYCGTWFIEALCSVFMDHACDQDIRDMLDLVSTKLNEYESEMGTKQTCTYKTLSFVKKLYFNPGIYLE